MDIPSVMSLIIITITIFMALFNASKQQKSQTNNQEPVLPNTFNPIQPMNILKPKHIDHNPSPPHKSYESTSAPKNANTHADLGIGKYKAKSSSMDDMGSGVYFSERDTSSLVKNVFFISVLVVLVVMLFTF